MRVLRQLAQIRDAVGGRAGGVGVWGGAERGEDGEPAGGTAGYDGAGGVDGEGERRGGSGELGDGVDAVRDVGEAPFADEAVALR